MEAFLWVFVKNCFWNWEGGQGTGRGDEGWGKGEEGEGWRSERGENLENNEGGNYTAEFARRFEKGGGRLGTLREGREVGAYTTPVHPLWNVLSQSASQKLRWGCSGIHYPCPSLWNVLPQSASQKLRWGCKGGGGARGWGHTLPLSIPSEMSYPSLLRRSYAEDVRGGAGGGGIQYPCQPLWNVLPQSASQKLRWGWRGRGGRWGHTLPLPIPSEMSYPSLLRRSYAEDVRGGGGGARGWGHTLPLSTPLKCLTPVCFTEVALRMFWETLDRRGHVRESQNGQEWQVVCWNSTVK